MSIEIDPVFGCHLATGRLDKDGYAYHGSSRAHIVAWVRANGPVPEGLVCDHICRVRRCCNPTHIEAVTQTENLRRIDWRYRARRTHCAKGHELRLTAMVTPQGGRICRICSKETP